MRFPLFYLLPCVAVASTSIDVNSVTNRYFSDYDEYIDFRDDQYETVTNLITVARTVTNDTWSASTESGRALTQIHLTQSRLTTTYDETSDPDVRSGIASAQVYLGRAETLVSESYDDSLDAYYRSLSDLSTLESVKRGIEQSDVPTYQIVVEQTSGGGGGGGCSCPDYTAILNTISSQLGSIYLHLHNFIVPDIEDITHWLSSFLYGLDEPFGSASDESEIGYFGGFNLGLSISNFLAAVDSLNLYPQIGNGIFEDYPVSDGPAFVREMWNYILQPFAQVMAAEDLTQNPAILSFRDFYRYRDVHPTNTSDNALWVRWEIGDDSASSGSPGSSSNPLFVQITNDLHISGGTVNVTNDVRVEVLNLFDITNYLRDIYINVHNEANATADVNVEVEEQQDDFQGELENGDDFSVSVASDHDILSVWRSIKTALENIKALIPQETMMPYFEFNPHMRFGGSGSSPSRSESPDISIDGNAVQLGGGTASGGVLLGLRFVRAAFTAGWWITCIGIGISCSKLVFRAVVYGFSLMMAIAQGDPSMFVNLFPRLSGVLTGSGSDD